MERTRVVEEDCKRRWYYRSRVLVFTANYKTFKYNALYNMIPPLCSYCSSRMWLPVVFILLIRCTSTVSTAASSGNDFDPYVMNGGLITAVAGRDYMIMATDTRMMGSSGYDILERHHIHTRLWAPTSSVDVGVGVDSTTSSSTESKSGSESEGGLIAPDGSLNIHLFDEIQKLQPQQQQQQQQQQQTSSSSSSSSSLRLLRQSTVQDAPILVGSVGCQADCVQLKRMIRSELRTAIYFGEISIDDNVRRYHDVATVAAAAGATTHSIPIDTMAVLLSQILYSRRTFPFGCYCILGGMSLDGTGQVYGYDAIGSYEQLAIACTGTGFELLQPILDRQFNPLIPSSLSSLATSSPHHGKIIRRPSALQVDCPTVEEAIQILIKAYRSVSEREIGVGDHVVFYSIQRIQERITSDDEKTSLLPNQNENEACHNYRQSPTLAYQSKIWTAPLKKH